MVYKTYCMRKTQNRRLQQQDCIIDFIEECDDVNGTEKGKFILFCSGAKEACRRQSTRITERLECNDLHTRI